MYNNSTEEIYVEPAQAHIAIFLTLYVLVSIIGIIGNVSLMAALASSGASRLRSPQLLSACAADLLVCAASAPLAATRAARIHYLPCHISYYIESLPVAATTFSLVAIAADRCCAVRRGRNSLCSKPYLAVTLVSLTAVLLGAVTVIATCLSWPPLAAAHSVVTYCVPIVAMTRRHWMVRDKLTALSLTARAAHGELLLLVPLMRRPIHVIILTGVGARERRDAVDVGDVKARKLQPSLLGPQPQMSTLRSRRRLGNVLIAIAAIFEACWCPYAAIVICSAFVNVPMVLAQHALLFGHAHSALNAAAYWLVGGEAIFNKRGGVGCVSFSPCPTRPFSASSSL